MLIEGEHSNRPRHDLCLSKAITRFSGSKHSNAVGDKQVYIQWVQVCVCAVLLRACYTLIRAWQFSVSASTTFTACFYSVKSANYWASDLERLPYRNPLFWSILNSGCVHELTTGSSCPNMPQRRHNRSSIHEDVAWSAQRQDRRLYLVCFVSTCHT